MKPAAPATALAAPPAEDSPPPTPRRRPRRSCCCWAVCILVPILAALAGRVEDAARLLVVHVVQHSVGRGALKNAPVTLKSLHIELRDWRIELRGLRIGNVPGEWDAPHAVTLERLRLSVGGLLGLLSLLQVPQANKAGAPGYATQGLNPGVAEPRQVCYYSRVRASPWTVACCASAPSSSP